jgi:hypothetical protein
VPRGAPGAGDRRRHAAAAPRDRGDGRASPRGAWRRRSSVRVGRARRSGRLARPRSARDGCRRPQVARDAGGGAADPDAADSPPRAAGAQRARSPASTSGSTSFMFCSDHT